MKRFFDSNIVIYAFTVDPRSAVAEQLLEEGGEISVQVLNEFVNVARRKLGLEWAEIEDAVDALQHLARNVHPIGVNTHREALRLAGRYGFSFYDALIVASALIAECSTLLSEDLHDGLIVDDRLRIENPFAAG